MEKIIFINNPAATMGGAVTILKEFIDNVVNKFEKEYKFYIFCSIDLSSYTNENIIIVNCSEGKNIINRMKWDFYGIKKWAKNNNINPDLVISLQNTGIKAFKDTPKITYIHQAISYTNRIKWNIFNKEEQKYIFYKYIYRKIIGITTRKNKIVVQTKWMKEEVMKAHKFNNNDVYVIRPNINLNKYILNKSYKVKNEDEINLIYPSGYTKYKNHLLLINMIEIVKHSYQDKKIKLYFTFDKSESKEIVRLIEKMNLENEVVFIGMLKFDKLLDFYNECDIILFPSYLETMGLPLLEAAYLHKSIIVSDLEYSRETLRGYDGAMFVDYKDCIKWAEAVKCSLNKHMEYKTKHDESTQSWDSFINIIRNLCEN